MTAVDLRPGDLAACFGSDLISRVIRLGTFSLLAPRGLRLPPSHVAMICSRGTETLWVESTTLCDHPCRIRGLHTSGAQAHRPEERIGDYLAAGGAVEFYRLVDIDSFSRDEAALLSRILLDHFVRRGLNYDYGGAVLSGTRVFQRTRLFPGADLEHLFCSEMVAAVLMRLGRLNRENPARFHPGRLLRTLVRTGVYRRMGRLEGTR